MSTEQSFTDQAGASDPDLTLVTSRQHQQVLELLKEHEKQVEEDKSLLSAQGHKLAQEKASLAHIYRRLNAKKDRLSRLNNQLNAEHQTQQIRVKKIQQKEESLKLKQQQLEQRKLHLEAENEASKKACEQLAKELVRKIHKLQEREQELNDQRESWECQRIAEEREIRTQKEQWRKLKSFSLSRFRKREEAFQKKAALQQASLNKQQRQLEKKEAKLNQAQRKQEVQLRFQQEKLRNERQQLQKQSVIVHPKPDLKLSESSTFSEERKSAELQLEGLKAQVQLKRKELDAITERAVRPANDVNILTSSQSTETLGQLAEQAEDILPTLMRHFEEIEFLHRDLCDAEARLAQEWGRLREYHQRLLDLGQRTATESQCRQLAALQQNVTKSQQRLHAQQLHFRAEQVKHQLDLRIQRDYLAQKAIQVEQTQNGLHNELLATKDILKKQTESLAQQRRSLAGSHAQIQAAKAQLCKQEFNLKREHAALSQQRLALLEQTRVLLAYRFELENTHGGPSSESLRHQLESVETTCAKMHAEVNGHIDHLLSRLQKCVEELNTERFAEALRNENLPVQALGELQAANEKLTVEYNWLQKELEDRNNEYGHLKAQFQSEVDKLRGQVEDLANSLLEADQPWPLGEVA